MKCLNGMFGWDAFVESGRRNDRVVRLFIYLFFGSWGNLLLIYRI